MSNIRFAPGERIVWVNVLNYGPVTSIVEEDAGNGYWCTTAPESKKWPTYFGARYFVCDGDVKKYLNRRLAVPIKESERRVSDKKDAEPQKPCNHEWGYRIVCGPQFAIRLCTCCGKSWGLYAEQSAGWHEIDEPTDSNE